MVEGQVPEVQIGQMNLRLPGKDDKAGHRIANGIGDSLAQQMPSGLQGQIGALNLRVRLPPGASETEMSHAIASSIVNALQKGEQSNQISGGEL